MDKPELPKKKSEKPGAIKDYPMFSSRIDGGVKDVFYKWASDNGYSIKDATEYAMKLAIHSTQKQKR